MIDARDPLAVDQPVQPVQNSRRSGVKTGRRGPQSAVGKRKSLQVQRVFSDEKINPFDQIEWDKRTAEITDDGGKVIFKQEQVEVPKSWSLLATKVVVSKYFY